MDGISLDELWQCDDRGCPIRIVQWKTHRLDDMVSFTSSKMCCDAYCRAETTDQPQRIPVCGISSTEKENDQDRLLMGLGFRNDVIFLKKQLYYRR